MKSRFLFPNYCHLVGYCCFISVVLLNITLKIMHPNGFAQELHHAAEPGMKLSHDITALLILSGFVFIAFSKQKMEDEHISLIRLESLQWAVYLNYFILAICIVLINAIELMQVLLIAVWAPLIFFILRFKWKIWLLNRQFEAGQNVL